MRPVFILLALGSMGCKRLPPAPEGLDDSARYIVREFYGDDLTQQAGLDGFMAWYDENGEDLAEMEATTDSVSAFTLEDLRPEDIGHLPLPDDGRDLSLANGVVSVTSIDCTWEQASALLVRGDQHVVFEGEFDTYERRYLTSREAYEAADPPEVGEPLDPFAADYDGEAWAGAMLLTDNDVTATELNVYMAYGLTLHSRQGVRTIHGEDVRVFAILSWLPQAYSNGQDGEGDTTWRQGYNLEVDIEQGDRTLRMFAIWNYFESIFPADSPIWGTNAVSKTRGSSSHLSEICRGEVELPPESP